jgi:DNA-binding transcriptional MerR regulator
MTQANRAKGPLVTISDAARMADISTETIRKYVNQGILKTEFDGGMVYYRELLRASWETKQRHMTSNAGDNNYRRQQNNV